MRTAVAVQSATVLVVGAAATEAETNGLNVAREPKLGRSTPAVVQVLGPRP